MATVRIGDVFAISTSAGWGFGQVIGKDAILGHLVRILDRTLPSTPTDPKELVAGDTRFYTFFPVGAAISRDLVKKLGNVAVVDARAPILRQPGRIERDGRVSNWWIWDGKQRWKVDSLNREQRQLSIAEIINDTLLRERIESGWTPDREVPS